MDIEAYRPYLFGIAYRMLGTAMEAEDVLQEAYLRTRDVDAEDIRAPKAYLAKMVTRMCLDQLKTARAQREVYPGIWLPEPIPTPDAAPSPIHTEDGDMDSLSLAFLILLEQLSPAERAVFLLREVFDYDYGEIGAMLDKDEAACRQLFHRAKTHLREHRPRFSSSPEAQQKLFTRFMMAVSSGDVQALTNLLAEDAVTWSDGGGKAAAAVRPIRGAEAIARFMLGLAKIGRDWGVTYEFQQVNHQPALITRLNGQIINVLMAEMDDEHIYRLLSIANPDKLRLLKIPIE
ncbi:MAG: RNA polymerase sigma-70 factor [Anaerolineae bacterium]